MATTDRIQNVYDFQYTLIKLKLLPKSTAIFDNFASSMYRYWEDQGVWFG
jgi:hypothetical protein